MVRITSLGVVVRSVFVGTPAWKSALVVSVRHALVVLATREKFWVVVPASVTTMLKRLVEY